MDEVDGGELAGEFGLGEEALLFESFAFGFGNFEKRIDAAFVARADEASGFFGGFGRFGLGGESLVEFAGAEEGVFGIANGDKNGFAIVGESLAELGFGASLVGFDAAAL